MKQKIILFGLIFFIAYSAAPAFASEVQNCSPDITTSVPDHVAWENLYIVRGDDGTAWQRAIINQKESTLAIREGETFTVRGTAQPNQPVQIFVYAKDGNGASINRPSTGVCFQIAQAESGSGFFSVDIDASLLWPNIGKEVVLDAFSRLETSWDQLQGAKTNNNYFIGTHIFPAIVNVVSDTVKDQAAEQSGRNITTPQPVAGSTELPVAATNEASCRNACGAANGGKSAQTLLEGVFLDPAKAPTQEIANDFNAVGSRAITLARNEGGHTQYAAADGGIADTEALRDITTKALSLELIKQGLLGIVDADSKISGVGTISATQLKNFIEETGTDTFTKQLLTDVKKIITGATDKRKAAHDIASLLMHKDVTADLPAAIINALPATADETNWADQFVTALGFWTGSTAPNTCLMLCDGKQEKNFNTKRMKDNYSCNSLDPTSKTNAQTNFAYVQGQSPRILLSTLDQVTLTPAFDKTSITYASKDFDSGAESWTFPQGKKDELYYRYAFTETYSGNFVGDACLQKTDINGYVGQLAQRFSLNEGEQKALIAEMNTGLIDRTGFYGMRIADPNDIAERFVWKNGAKTLDLFRLFFEAKKGTCSKTSFGNIELVRPASTDGFETGILL